MASSSASSDVPSSNGQLSEQERLEALRAQEQEFLFEQAREQMAKKWLPNLTGEMDPETDSEPESSD